MSLSSHVFPAWMRRAVLPVGFAVVVTAGSSLLMHEVMSTASEAPAPVAQLIPPPPAIEVEPAHRGGHSAPSYVRAIEPDAVYVAPHVEKTSLNQRSGAKSVELPAGVQRFDDCGSACDTRDPLIVHTTYAPAPATPNASAAPAPQPAEQKADNSLFSLPKWDDGVALIDRAKDATVSATHSAVDTARQAVNSVTDFAAGLVR